MPIIHFLINLKNNLKKMQSDKLPAQIEKLWILIYFLIFISICSLIGIGILSYYVDKNAHKIYNEKQPLFNSIQPVGYTELEPLYDILHIEDSENYKKLYNGDVVGYYEIVYNYDDTTGNFVDWNVTGPNSKNSFMTNKKPFKTYNNIIIDEKIFKTVKINFKIPSHLNTSQSYLTYKLIKSPLNIKKIMITYQTSLKNNLY